MLGRYPCQTKASRSGSRTRFSLPASSKRHSSTRSATSLNRAKLVPPPSYVAPSGYGAPGQIFIAGRLARVAQQRSDALARGLLHPAADEPDGCARAERRTSEELVDRPALGRLHAEITQRLLGEGQMRRVRPEPRGLLTVSCVGED